ncbi:hypothetical protein BN85400470 [Alteracholeplasma palmae J233]|uniref:Uncharacterized protein n=1 Tax=Alteracholeplasma palmae (strain ATCC 49389 / J233) TaxID=1318466 RepID=U4KJJ5_ALTPJ|nr:hypothetical protein BN85400470 [Alteracholeplasma palmae J233]
MCTQNLSVTNYIGNLSHCDLNKNMEESKKMKFLETQGLKSSAFYFKITDNEMEYVDCLDDISVGVGSGLATASSTFNN